MNGDDPQHRDPRDPRAGRGGPPRQPQPPQQGRPMPQQGRPVPPQQPRQGQPMPPRRVPPPQRPGRPMPPGPEGTQVIRRDGRPAQPPHHGQSAGSAPAGPRAWSQEPRAWSQEPQPGRHEAGSAGPQQARAYRPQDPNHGSSPYAPTQTPQPYADPYGRRAGRVAPPAAPPRRNSPPSPPQQPPRAAKARRKHHWGRWIGLVLVALLVIGGGAVVYLDRSLHRIDALADYPGRVADTPGTNWLLVGSDSREGMTPEEEADLSTGGEVGGDRTDTMMIMHLPESGTPTMVSIPRDSYVPIPGYGRDKINAAYAFGGAPLLVQTIEGATGLRMDHYAEIGFEGFAEVVDALGGIDICVPYPIDDPLAGVNLQAGCQVLDGQQALGFVRSRATPNADMDRMNNQRTFMAALLEKATSPSVLLNPFKLWPMVTAAADAMTVDEGDHLWNLAGLAWAMRGDLVTTTVPVAGFEDVDGSGNVLLWDRDRASQFFGALAEDQPIPPELLTTN